MSIRGVNMKLFQTDLFSGIYIIYKEEHKDILGSRDIVFSWRTLDENGLAPIFKYEYELRLNGYNQIAGLFYQFDQSSLIRCIEQKLDIIIVDLRLSSSTYKKSMRIELNEYGKNQILITSGFAYGIISHGDNVVVNIKSTKSYQKEDLILINFTDPELDLNIISKVTALPEYLFADNLNNVLGYVTQGTHD